MKKSVWMILACLFLAVGCSNQKENNQAVEKPIDVSVLLPSKGINTNEDATLRAEVTQNGKVVSDADKVDFEIGKVGEDSLVMLPGVNGKDGIYSTSYKFKDAGNYYVIAHVTARDQHTMPKIEFPVNNTTASNGNVQGNQTAHNEEHHHGDATIHLMGIENIKSNKENMFMIHIQTPEGKPVEKANVRIETWKDVNGKHDYTDAKESKPGEYEVNYTFKETGTNYVKVHVEKENLHEHIEEKVTVN